jgi:hypothetical protein
MPMLIGIDAVKQIALEDLGKTNDYLFCMI